MKKLILFLSVVSVSLFITSCLKGGDTRQSGQDFFYVTQIEDGTQIAHNPGFAITSAEIRALREVDRWYIIGWSWETGNGITGTNIHNAVTSAIDMVPLGTFIKGVPPKSISVPVLDVRMLQNIPIASSYGDYLIVQCSWDKKENEQVEVKLYNDDVKIDETGVVAINLRLDKPNESTDAKEKSSPFAAIKMSHLRSLINDFGANEYRDIQLKFNFYKTATEEKSVNYTVRVYKK